MCLAVTQICHLAVPVAGLLLIHQVIEDGMLESQRLEAAREAEADICGRIRKMADADGSLG